MIYLLKWSIVLGAYRHKGIIPWDDDVDILINEKYASQIKNLLRIEVILLMMINYRLRVGKVTYLLRSDVGVMHLIINIYLLVKFIHKIYLF